MQTRHRLTAAIAVFWVVGVAPGARALERDVPYVPTPEPVVREMLRLANVSEKDTLYDLGCGDGRIVVIAAKERGAHGVGVDIDPDRIAESRANAKWADVTDKVRFIEGDLFKVDLRPATAVTLYLLPDVNLRLRPKLLSELKPGTPIVSHQFDMGDWEPEVKTKVGFATVYLWHVPARVSNRSDYELRTADGRVERHQLEVTQHLQKISGSVTIDGEQFPIENGRINGERVRFSVNRPSHGTLVQYTYEGQVIDGEVRSVTAGDVQNNFARR
ncbi:MAG: SAM-dependent methyltransferase [Sulfurifustis sp.]